MLCPHMSVTLALCWSTSSVRCVCVLVVCPHMSVTLALCWSTSSVRCVYVCV